MIYSVWNQSRRRYDYYEAGGPPGEVNAPPPKHLSQTKLGMTVTQASWPLPVGSRPVGSGELARGRIAHPRGGAVSGFDLDSDLLKAGLLLAAAYVLWKKVR